MTNLRLINSRALAIALLILIASAHVRADEGHWPFDQVPIERIQAQYGVRLSPAWLKNVERATVRVGREGTSGTFVSANGLVLTAHHVAAQEAPNGFVANDLAGDRPFPGLTLDVLVDKTDVTREVQKAIPGGLTAHDYFDKRRQVIGSLEASAARGRVNAAQIVMFSGGTRYVLYRYHRYTDVRLVMSPDDATGYFTGPYPSPSLDFTFLRGYEHGKPARTPDFLTLSRIPPTEGQPVFVSGAPYDNRKRNWTAADFAHLRDVELPLRSESIHKLVDRITASNAAHPDHSKYAQFIADSSRFISGVMDDELSALRDPALVPAHQQLEVRIVSALSTGARGTGEDLYSRIRLLNERLTTPELHALLMPWTVDRDSVPWHLHNDVLPWGAYLAPPSFSYAALLLRAREERLKPSEERAVGFRDAQWHRLERWMTATGCPDADPCGPAWDAATEELMLTEYLETLAEHLPAADPLARTALDGHSPAAQAHRLITGTQLGDAAFRRRVLESDDIALATLYDPMLDFVRALQAVVRPEGLRYPTLAEELNLFQALKPVHPQIKCGPEAEGALHGA